MKTAVISLTENGRMISLKIAESGFICDRYAFEKHTDENAKAFAGLSRLTADIFGAYDGIVFICACGIAVRMIAPYIISKTSDPAVIVIDEQGKYAVSLLSGHIGGANSLALRLAELIGAEPIITTATDIGGKFSPDSFAVANDLYICEMDIAKNIAAEIADGRQIGFYSDYSCKNIPCFDNSGKYGICISDSDDKNPFEVTLHLIPRNIVIGAGCRKNIDSELFSGFIMALLKENKIDLRRIQSVNTIILKQNEKALVDFCKANNLKMKAFSSEQLMAVKGDFSHSDFVMRTTGADNICERSAAAEGGHIIVRKTSRNAMTFAATEMPIDIDFERSII